MIRHSPGPPPSDGLDRDVEPPADLSIGPAEAGGTQIEKTHPSRFPGRVVGSQAGVVDPMGYPGMGDPTFYGGPVDTTLSTPTDNDEVPGSGAILD